MSDAAAAMRRLSKLCSASSLVCRALVQARTAQEAAAQVCQRLVGDGGFVLAWIGRRDEPAAEIVPTAWNGAMAWDLEKIRSLGGDGPEGGLARAALGKAGTVVWNDFVAKCRGRARQKLAREAGLRSAAAFPMQFGGGAEGVLALYWPEADFFGATEISLLEEMAGTICPGLDRIGREEAQKTQLEELRRQFAEASRLADMAEVADNLLHNVGNVLGSIHVSSSVVSQKIRNSRMVNIAKLAALFEENAADLPGFLAGSRGRQVPSYLADLGRHLAAEREEMLRELHSLNASAEHVKEIVAARQNFAQAAGVLESVLLPDLVDAALEMHKAALGRHAVVVTREFDDTPPILVDKHKVLQILINLLQNAKYALHHANVAEKRLTLRVENAGAGRVRLRVADNGAGIAPEHLPRLFERGFTTRKGGRGLGLRGGALAARELGGALTADSDGPGRGAVFTLELPCQPKKASP